MIRRDYILRLFDRLAVMLRPVLGLRKAGDPAKAHQLIETAFKELVGMDPKLLEALAFEDLLGLMTAGGETDPAKLLVAARLLAEKAGVYQDEKKEERVRDCRLKALRLYLKTADSPAKAGAPDPRREVEVLVDWLGFDSMPEDLKEAVSRLRRA